MVESTIAVPSSSTEPPLPVPKKVPLAEIGTCGCPADQLQTFCRKCDQALCNDCYFEYHGTCGKGMTLKQAAALQISQFEAILNSNNTAFGSCSEMATQVERQEGIEEEVIKKVNKQYDQLKAIIDEQRLVAQDTIKNLESIQEYTPPRKDFTKETLD